MLQALKPLILAGPDLAEEEEDAEEEAEDAEEGANILCTSSDMASLPAAPGAQVGARPLAASWHG